MAETDDKIVYPKLLDEHFKNNTILIKQIPDTYRIVSQAALPDKTMKTTKAFVLYIKKELAFWDYPELSNNPIVSKYKSYFNQALTNIQNAINTVDTNPQQAISYLKNSINVIQVNCQIASTTQLARLFKSFKSKTNHFFYGFQSAITVNGSTNYYNYSQWHEGFYYGMGYKQAISSIESFVREYNLTYIEATKQAEIEIENLLSKSNTLFHDQEQRVIDLWNNNKTELEKQKEETLSFIKEKNEKLLELEKTYEEKLRLSEPADYWKKMSTNYNTKGIVWLIISAFLSIGIIIGLVFLIIKTPNLFAESSYWLDLIKDTALLTVMTSVAIYILRITVKLAMSSFHLSRDAKEREQLSYFYLSLMKTNAISENERALIINALFSRSDTGLLKGDSAPTMTANITDLLEKDKSK